MGNQHHSPEKPIPGKWKINSIHWGGQILGAVGLFVFVLPLGLYIFSRIFHLPEAEHAATLTAMKISIATGAVLLGLFMMILAVEFIQDHRLNVYYSRNKKTKLELADGQYECQHCGARTVSALDQHCPVCGEEFQFQVGEYK